MPTVDVVNLTSRKLLLLIINIIIILPIIHIHGTDDFIVRYYPPTIDFSMTALEAMDWWSVENNLTEQSYLQLNDNVTFFTNYSLNSTTKFTHIQVEAVTMNGLIMIGGFMRVKNY